MPDPNAIAAGRMRHLVTLAAAESSTAKDAFGQAITSTPKPVAAMHAAIEALQGRELYAAQQFVSDVTHRISIRYKTGVRAGQLVLYQGRRFIVQAVLNPEERNIRLDLLCLEQSI